MVAYLFLGETSIGRERVRRLDEADQRLSAPRGAGIEPGDPVAATVSDLCRSINGFGPTRGNRIVLLGDPAASPDKPTLDCDRAIQELIEAIGAATEHVHVSFYIWLDDGNGGRVADAISAAARRGVTCRVMADALGSRGFVRGPRWRQLREAGVHVQISLQDIPRMGHAAVGRVDLRNHRKLVVHRQPDRVLRQPELRRPMVPDQGEVRPLDRRPAALRGSGRAAGAAPVPRHLDRRDRPRTTSTSCLRRRRSLNGTPTA